MGTKFHGHKAQIFEYSEEYTIYNNNFLIFGNFITKNKNSPLEIQKIYALRSCPSNAPWVDMDLMDTLNRMTVSATTIEKMHIKAALAIHKENLLDRQENWRIEPKDV